MDTKELKERIAADVERIRQLDVDLAKKTEELNNAIRNAYNAGIEVRIDTVETNTVQRPDLLPIVVIRSMVSLNVLLGRESR